MSVIGVILGGHLKLNSAWSNLLLDYGATTVLGVVLFLLQRNFVSVVNRREEVLREEIVVVRQDFDERFVEQQSVLHQLNESVAALTTERHAKEDAVIARISSGDNVGVLKTAIEMAGDRNLIGPGFRVRVDQELGGLRFTATPLYLHDRGVAPTPKMSLTVWRKSGLKASVVVDLDKTIDGTMALLVAEMERNGLTTEADTFNPQSVVEALQTSLQLALDIQHGEKRGISGKLIEMYNADLAISTAGIESLSRGVLIPATDFPSTIKRFQTPGSTEMVVPAPPPGVTDEVWSDIVAYARIDMLGSG